ncbi:MAG: YraN family protein [Rikenellaceae bacterium]
MSCVGADIGSAGEKIAMQWLRRNGYLIRDLNWRAGRYELDIVAEKWGVIHFVEVKTRRSDGLTTPEDAMTRNKKDSLIKAARSYLSQYKIENEFQFDLVAVETHPDLSVDIRLTERVVDIRW